MTDPAAARTQKPADWPDVFRVAIWLVQEDDEQWQALAGDFDVVGQGASKDLALRNVQELLTEYLLSCAEDGMSFKETRRPIPAKEQARLQFQRLLTPLHRLRHHWVRRDRLIFSVPNDDLIHC